MSQKLRIRNTALDNLVSNLRGEVGETIRSWILLRTLVGQARQRRAMPGIDDFNDRELAFLQALADRLEDDVVARLSELAEQKTGRLTFHFASLKLGLFKQQVDAFRAFVRMNRFTEKRNTSISHKELPQRWSDHRHLHIEYASMVRALALAIRLMKKIDRVAVGREARYFWQKLRQRRYDYVISARAEYMIAPHIRLTEPERAAVLAEALQSRQLTWEPMETLLNGTKATIQVNKKWAAIVLGGRVLFLKEYPLQSLSSIDIDEQAPAKP